MAKAKKKVFFPQMRLAELAGRPGGMTRDEAVSAAVESLESMRVQADREIRKAIAAMEDIAIVGGALDAGKMAAVLRHADQVVTLAGMFGYTPLDTAARSLCDLADGLTRAGVFERAPIAVHVQTMHLLAPGSVNLSHDQAAQMLAELSKVAAHFNFGSLAEASSPDAFIAATAS